MRWWEPSWCAEAAAEDAEAAADYELLAMLDEVRSPDGGRLPRLVEGASTSTRAGVADLVARSIFRVSAYHAAINYNWWPWMGHAPNAPSILVAPPPSPAAPADEAALLAMLPPIGAAWETIAQIYGVAAIAVNRLGEYPDGFADPRVGPLRDAFARRLAEVEGTITARNATRFMPYTCLLPSLITASVNS